MNVKKIFPALMPLVMGIMMLSLIPCMVLADVKPGDVIDSSNYEKAKDYFPDSILRWINDGWGLEPPAVIKVVEAKPNFPPAQFMEETRKNTERVKLLPDGRLEGHTAGFPFPELKEPDIAMKIMWNCYYRWRGDDFSYPGGFMVNGRRKGGNISYGLADINFIQFDNRTSLDPKPEVKNPHQLQWAMTLLSLSPPEWKGMVTLVWRYKDPTKPDDMWTYVPTLRRTLRTVSSERSNPVRGTNTTWDDYYGFDGKIFEFNYKLIGEQKVLAVMNQSRYDYPGEHPILQDEFEMRDTYVIEVTAKNPRYPESKRILWIGKENYYPLYAESYDKAGKFWKGSINSFRRITLPNGEQGPFLSYAAYVDYKTGTWTANNLKKIKVNTGLNPSNFEPGSISGGSGF